MKNLKDQVVIATGGAAGIGGAVTSVLAQRGASVVAFLLSDDSRYMTGQTLMADGGNIKLR